MNRSSDRLLLVVSFGLTLGSACIITDGGDDIGDSITVGDGPGDGGEATGGEATDLPD